MRSRVAVALFALVVVAAVSAAGWQTAAAITHNATHAPQHKKRKPNKNCIRVPHGCSLPDRSNSGVPRKVALKRSGSITVRRAGATIRALDVAGSITVAARNVTIKNVRITASGGSGAWGIFINQGATGTTIEHSTIRGARAGQPGSIESAVWNHYNEPVTATRDYFYHCADCWEGSGKITHTYMVANGSFPGAHYEDIYDGGGSQGSLVVDHNTLLNPHPQTATVFASVDFGNQNTLRITRNLLAGGGYLVYGGASSCECGSTGRVVGPVTVTGNRFSRLYFPHGGYFGVAAYFVNAVTKWSDNVWDNTLARVRFG